MELPGSHNQKKSQLSSKPPKKNQLLRRPSMISLIPQKQGLMSLSRHIFQKDMLFKGLPTILILELLPWSMFTRPKIQAGQA